MPKLSVVIPCYNEERTLAAVVAGVLAAPRLGCDIEVVVVDDGSTDASAATLRQLSSRHPQISAHYHAVNCGKGAALRSGLRVATGDFVLVQDADLGYSPEDYPKLLKPALDGRADVVVGSRYKGGDETRVLSFWRALGNRVLTLASNMASDLDMTDVGSCTKLFRRDVVQAVDVVEDRFGVEPEIVAKLARMRPRPRIYEVGVSYAGRGDGKGTTTGALDGLRALYGVLRYNLMG